MSRKTNRTGTEFRGCALCLLVILLVMSISTGCEKVPDMNTDKCIEIALHYMRDKYQKDFLLGGSYTKFASRPPYVSVVVKSDENEDRDYYVIVYPDDYSDENGDGYIDSYHVVSDNYMPTLVDPLVKQEIEEDLKKMGVKQFNVSSVYVQQIPGMTGFAGLVKDFQIPDSDNFSIEKMANHYENIDISVWIQVPEGAYSGDIKRDIINYYRPKMTGASMFFYIYIYTQEIYDIRYSEKETRAYSGDKSPKETLGFSLEEED